LFGLSAVSRSNECLAITVLIIKVDEHGLHLDLINKVNSFQCDRSHTNGAFNKISNILALKDD